jgi:hypothetical protein
MVSQIATLGANPWWKKHLTTAQIVQFCLDVPATGVATALKARALRVRHGTLIRTRSHAVTSPGAPFL